MKKTRIVTCKIKSLLSRLCNLSWSGRQEKHLRKLIFSNSLEMGTFLLCITAYFYKKLLNLKILRAF